MGGVKQRLEESEAGDRNNCELKAVVHRGNRAEPEAPKEEAVPRDHGVLQV